MKVTTYDIAVSDHALINTIESMADTDPAVISELLDRVPDDSRNRALAAIAALERICGFVIDGAAK